MRSRSIVTNPVPGRGQTPGHSTTPTTTRKPFAFSPTSSPNMGKKSSPDKDKSGVTEKPEPPENLNLSQEEREQNPENKSTKRGSITRQSFSLDEGLLLSFSNKEFGWTPPPAPLCKNKNYKAPKNLSFNGGSFSGGLEIDQDEELLQSSKKREQCLRIYEKMAKTGMAVKLDTIFRGMMTPSEYRAFIKAAEDAAKAVKEQEQEGENNEGEKNGGNAPGNVSTS